VKNNTTQYSRPAFFGSVIMLFELELMAGGNVLKAEPRFELQTRESGDEFVSE